MKKTVERDNIKSFPIRTNKLTIDVDKDKFFATYSIISYYSSDEKLHKNLSYEQLSTCDFLSVCGIRSKWSDSSSHFTKFFILVNKSEQEIILNSLREYDSIIFGLDTFENYTLSQQQRIIASLAINSLGEKKSGKRLYNNGCLLVCDVKNFLVPERKKELVCLKIEVNEYLNLTAKTISFSNPSNEKVLYANSDCVFQVSKDIDGFLWSGYSVKPVILSRMKKSDIQLEKLYIQKKRFSNNKTTVPYWPFNPDNYTHGKLFAITQIIDSVNDKFCGLLHLGFTDFQVVNFDEYKTDKNTFQFLIDYLSDRKIIIDNPFGAKAKDFVSKIKTELKGLMNKRLSLSQKSAGSDLLIKICEPEDEKLDNTFYSKSLNRMGYDNNTAIQHITFHNDSEEDSFEKSEARRVLIELFVKDCLIKKFLPTELCQLIKGWNVIEYKIRQKTVLGAKLVSTDDNRIDIKDYGFSFDEMPIDFVSFANNVLLFKDYSKISGTKDYKVLIKDGNIYLIIDTDEIPILDAKKIDAAYENIDKKVWMFKRKGDYVVYDYLRGYIGYHLWKSDGINGEKDGAYSYISGFNSENLKILPSNKMDRMPRVRKIFILHCECPERIENDIEQIGNMLKFGFGRWNELMTYPFPFKFLEEYLDNKAEMAFDKHWENL